jgi:glucosamine--fructose-6-phosphate aminotransferase (isomerizing)
VEAARRALSHLRGAHGVVAFSSREPDKIVAARIGNAGGVVLGWGDGEMFIASDMPAILEHTRRMAFLESRQMAVVTRTSLEVMTLEGEPVRLEMHNVAWDPIAAEKGAYRHFMQKEIHEQVRSLTDTIGGRVDFEDGRICLPELNLSPERARRIRKLFITACGTAANAGMVGKVLIERIARLPVEVDIASEFRYSDPILDEDTAVLAISQSGETADTLAAMEEARRKGATLWSIVNVIGSQAMRIANGYISMQTGPEIGVASTKAFTTQLAALFVLTLVLAKLKRRLAAERERELIAQLRHLPAAMEAVLSVEPKVRQWARRFQPKHHALFLGRGVHFPIAMEGALKLKEISYIHAEAYAAGELKHGPLALVDADMPVVTVAPNDQLLDKLKSNMQEVRARGGELYVFADRDAQVAESEGVHVIRLVDYAGPLSPILHVIPLQLLAYHVALLRGTDVDKPRNLAKSVTVE